MTTPITPIIQVQNGAELDLDRLEALVRAVPDHLQLTGWYVAAPSFGHQHVYADNFKGQGRQHIASLPAHKTYFAGLADFIAAASPATVQALIALARRASQPAATVVPDGYVLMPKRLTADNGAKDAMRGEFVESITVRCHECEGVGEVEDGYKCAECDGAGTVEQRVAVEWDTIKRIYAHAVALLGQAPTERAAAPAQPDKDDFARGVIAALGVLNAHGYPHGSVYHDEIVQSVGEASIYAAAEEDDYRWAGLDPSKKPRCLTTQHPSTQKGGEA